MSEHRKTVRVPGPFEVLRHLPRLGLNLVLPAMVMGAVFGSLIDVILGGGGLFAKVGTIGGPVVFALSINAMERIDRASAADEMDAEDYRRQEVEKRRAAAEGRGELVRFRR